MQTYLDDLNLNYLSKEFVEGYRDIEPPFGQIGAVVYLRTYSRYLPKHKRREFWYETVARVVEYSISLDIREKTLAVQKELEEEARDLYDHIFNLKVFPAGRTLWAGGSEETKEDGSCNFNCSFRVIDCLDAYPEMMYLLMVGAGTGFSVEKQYIEKLPELYSIPVTHKPYKARPKFGREEFTTATFYNCNQKIGQFTAKLENLVDDNCSLISSNALKSNQVEIHVGDSKVGWCTALRIYLHLHTFSHIEHITFDYSSIRPQGERLKKMGGRASGPEPLKTTFQKIAWTIKYKTAENKLTPTSAMDFSNYIAEAIVCGGVRRSSQICLFSPEDKETLEAKTGLWDGGYISKTKVLELEAALLKAGYSLTTEKLWSSDLYSLDDLLANVVPAFDIWSTELAYQHAQEIIDEADPKYRYRSSRVMSNNSAHFWQKPSREYLFDIIHHIQQTGEPGFYNAETASNRRPNYRGTNPSLRKGTKVLTSEGIFEIQELEDKEFLVPNLYGNLSPAKCFLSGKNKPLYKITLRGGKVYYATAEHRWPIVTGECVIKVDTKELHPGLRLPILKQEVLYEGGRGLYEEGFFIGWLLGDGWVTLRSDTGKKQVGMVVSSDKEQVLPTLESIVKKYSTATFNQRPNKTKELNTLNQSLLDFIESFGFCGKTQLPTLVWKGSSENFRKGLISALFSSHGHVDNDPKNEKVVLTSKSLSFLEEVSELLGFYGIRSSVRKRKDTEGVFPNGKNYGKTYSGYSLVIQDRASIIHFANLFYLPVSYKQEALEAILSRVPERTTKFTETIQIKSVELTDLREDVWDLTVEDQTHCFKLSHCITGNCGEILLDSQGVCNLTETNVLNFVEGPDSFNYKGFSKAMKLSARMGSRMTNTTMWHPRWDEVQKRDRLIGPSLTGFVEAMDTLGWAYEVIDGQVFFSHDSKAEHLEQLAKTVVREEADSYHKEMGIPRSVLTTCVKPSGSISQLPGVSSGGHRPYAPYYLRRIRVSKVDPIAKSLKEMGIPVSPENAQGDDLYADRCNTWVFSFPVKTNAPIRAIDESAINQLERYKSLMQNYVEHSISFTSTVAPHEWDEVAEWLFENWDSYVGISFLPRFDPTEGTSPYPQLPYETLTKEQYEELAANMPNISEKEFNQLISRYEQEYEEFDLGADCDTGFCPIR